MKDEYVNYLKQNLPKEELDEGLRKLKMGISPQYIVGNVNFYGNEIIVNPNVLIPRFETELLVEKTISYIKDRFPDIDKLDILDIGTGSGCIAITLKKELSSRVVACDKSKEALEVASCNAIHNDVSISFVLSDIFSNINGCFDVIISNPPYIRENEDIDDMVKRNEPHMALYAPSDGLYFYREILKNCKKYLKNKFMIAFEIGELQGKDVSSLAYQYLDHISVIIEKDYSNRDRFVFVFSK